MISDLQPIALTGSAGLTGTIGLTGSVFGFAYGRVSSAAGGDGVSRQEQSIEVQDALFREYINAIGLPLENIQFFQERGSGAFTKQDIRRRREGARMWAEIVACRTQHPDAGIHLLLTMVDRIGRGYLATQIMFHELRAMRVRIHIIGLGGKSFDCDSLMGQKAVADLAFYSELEVATIRKRIQTTMDFKRERNQLCGQCPFGFDARETGETTAKGVRIRVLVDNPEEQKWILHMAGLRQRGWTSYAIAADMNARRVPTKEAGAVRRVHGETTIVRNKWTPGKIDKLLQSKTVTRWLQAQGKDKVQADEPVATP
jgi:DNA invertase Pin-like site-specific DNA recombinase